MLADLRFPHSALLDSGSTWCVLPPTAARELGCSAPADEPLVRMVTRLGVYDGWLDRIDLTLPASIGEPITVQATWWISPDWPGPMIIGWRGCLERFHWAVDPSEQAFYFAR